MQAKERLIYPLDVASLAEARDQVALLAGEVGVFKVGLELFTTSGPEAVRLVHDAGARCFLDLKLHDIGETVARSVAAAVALRVRFLTVHAVNGARALARAAQAAAGSDTQLLAVTVLTSLEDADLAEIGLSGPTGDAVTRLAGVAFGAGVPGLVCSPRECASLRAALGPAGRGPVLVVPGVRPAGAATNDQRRVATPADAIRAGADYLVVGRPIRDAADPRGAARAIVAEIADATSAP
jgi:orotidine-5'-phosphate decarboxylase